MGVLNVTPDSFSDGGHNVDLHSALCTARSMCAEGVDIIDVGGESTRPGAGSVAARDELARVIPVIEGIRTELDVCVSIDTSKPAIMKAALDAGVDMINDVYALRAKGALNVVAHSNAMLCLMHMLGEPRTMQNNPVYGDVVTEVGAFLVQRLAECARAGIPRGRLLIDPGFGFGKTLAHNVELLSNLRELCRLDVPLLVGLSRKSMLGSITGRGVDDRLAASLAAATLAAVQGARVIRCHDVGPTLDAMKIVAQLETKNRV